MDLGLGGFTGVQPLIGELGPESHVAQPTNNNNNNTDKCLCKQKEIHRYRKKGLPKLSRQTMGKGLRDISYYVQNS